MSAALTLLGSITASTTNSGNKTVTATPAVGDLIFLLCGATGNTSTTAPTDNNSDGLGSYTQVGSTFLKNASADALTVWVRNGLIGSASSTVFTHNPGTTSGGVVAVLKATGMSVAGLKAVRQSAGQQNQASSGTPAPVLPATPYRENPVFGAVFNATNPATMTPRSSPAYTERGDVGYATPTTGFEVMTIDSGETSATITWGGTSASAFASFAAELNTTAFFEPHVSTDPQSAQMDATASITEGLTVSDAPNGSLPATVGAPAPLPSIGLLLAGATNDYTKSIVESLVAQDLLSALLTAAASVVEPHVSTDPQSGAMAAVAAVSEPHVSTDPQAINPSSAISETIVAQDSQSAAMAAGAAVSEPHVSTALTDGSTGSAFLGVVSETIVAQDPQAAAMAAAATVSESHVSTDLQNGAVPSASVGAPAPLPSIGLLLGVTTAFTGAVSEALVAQDPQSAAMAAAAAINESHVSATPASAAAAAAASVAEPHVSTDPQSAAMAASAAVVEQAVAQDASVGSAGGAFAGVLSEVLVAQDVLDGVVVSTEVAPQTSDEILPAVFYVDPGFAALYFDGLPVGTPPAMLGDSLVSIGESSTAQDLLSAAVAVTAGVVETIVAQDPQSAAMAAAASLVEPHVSATPVDAAGGKTAAVSEALTAQDVLQSALPGAYLGIVNEALAAQDPQSAAMAAAAAVSEPAVVQDASTGALALGTAEVLTAQDVAFATLAAACSILESLGVSDVCSATVGISGAFFASITETLDVIASAQASASAAAVLIEALVSADVSKAQFLGELLEDPRFIVVGPVSDREVSKPSGAFNIVKEA